MIDERVAVVALETAGELVPRYGVRVEAEVEAAIYGGGKRKESSQYVDPVTLGAQQSMRRLGTRQRVHFPGPPDHASAVLQAERSWTCEHSFSAHHIEYAIILLIQMLLIGRRFDDRRIGRDSDG